MEWKITHVAETDSTNRWLRENGSREGTVVVADYQTAGRGCGTNRWESERGKNLLFSVLLHPQDVTAQRQFGISQAVSVALCEVLSHYAAGFTIKWPNDIYWHDRKVSGMLIENQLQAGRVTASIVGIGLNVNQRRFLSDAPNPVSLCQILGREADRRGLLHEFLGRLGGALLANPPVRRYQDRLYRRGTMAQYADDGGRFRATIDGVEADGRLLMTGEDGARRRYAFKEVSFII